MRRKIICIVLLIVTLFSILATLTGCGNNKSNEKTENTVKESNQKASDEESKKEENKAEKTKSSDNSTSNTVETVQNGNEYKIPEANDFTGEKYYILTKTGDKFSTWRDYKNNQGNFTILSNGMKPGDIDSMWNETGYIGFFNEKTNQYAIVYWIDNSQKPYRAYIFEENNGKMINSRITSEIYIDDIFATSDKEKHAPVSYAPDISGNWEGRTGSDLVKISLHTEGTKKIFTLDYYANNNNHYTEEVTGEWKTDGFEIATELAVYEFNNIIVDNNTMTFSVKVKNVIVQEAKSLIIKDGIYKVNKTK